MSCTLVFQNKECFACKPLNSLEKTGVTNVHEPVVLNYVSHPNIIKFISISGEKDVFLLEIFTCTAYKFFIEDEEDDHTLQKSILFQVAIGLRYLHKNNIVHLNLNTDTVVVKSIGGRCEAKITELNDSKFMINSNVIPKSNNHVPYRAPEILSNEGVLSPALDIYAYGMLSLNILSNKESSHNQDPNIWLEALKENKDNDFIEERFKHKKMEQLSLVIHFISNCLSYNPKNRPQIGSIIENDIFKKFQSNKTFEAAYKYEPIYNYKGEYNFTKESDNKFRIGLKWITKMYTTFFNKINVVCLFWNLDLLYKYRRWLDDDNRVYQAAMASIRLILKTVGYPFNNNDLLDDLKKIYSTVDIDKIDEMEISILEQLDGNLLCSELYNKCVTVDDLKDLYDHMLDHNTVKNYLNGNHEEFYATLKHGGNRKADCDINLLFSD